MRKETVIENIPVKQIIHSRFCLRDETYFDRPGDLAALAQSIRENGVIVPLEVFTVPPDQYELIHGHRRFEAAKLAGLKHVPCIMADPENENVALVRGILENLHREDLKPLEEARGLAHLMSVTGQSVMDLERQGFGSETHLRDLIRLLDQPQDIQALVGIGDPKARTEPLSLAHVKAAIGPHQAAILRKAAREGLTRQQTREITLAVSQAEDEKRAEVLIGQIPFDTRVHDPEHEKARTERHAAKAKSGTPLRGTCAGAGEEEAPAVEPTWIKKVTSILDSWTARVAELTAMSKAVLEGSAEDEGLQGSLDALRDALRLFYDTVVPAHIE